MTSSWGLGGGAMNNDSPNVGTSGDKDDNDISRRHPAGLSFWGVRTFESRIHAVVVESSQDVNGAEEVRVPLLQRGGGWWHHCCRLRKRTQRKATSDMRRQRRTTTGRRHRAAARARAQTATLSSRRSSRRRTTTTMTTRIGWCGGCHSGNSSL